MKKTCLLFALLISSFAFCQYVDRDYDVKFKDSRGSFTFSVETDEMQPSPGDLVISDLHISMPRSDFTGAISMELILDPTSEVHLTVLGKRTGVFTFSKGKHLPQIPDGQYEVIIDGYSYGHMLVDKKQGNFFPLEK